MTIPRYRAVGSAAHAVFYVAADLARLREEFRKLEEPYPDPEHCCPPIFAPEGRAFVE